MNTSTRSMNAEGERAGRWPRTSRTLWIFLGAAFAGIAWMVQPGAATDRGSGMRIEAAAPFSPTGEVDQPQPYVVVPLDHSVVVRTGVAHESDQPGASIAAYEP